MVVLEESLTGDVGISCGVKELHDLAVSHERELTLVRHQKYGKLPSERVIVALDLLAKPLCRGWVLRLVGWIHHVDRLTRSCGGREGKEVSNFRYAR